MTSDLMFTTVANTDMNTLIIAYNAAYDDYFVPIQATPQTLRQIQQYSDIRFDASQVAWRDGQIVGFGFLGIRGNRAWASSIAVLPAFRQQGIGRAVMNALISSAHQYGIQHIQLEVSETNIPALALYEGLGFQRQRRVLSVGCDEPSSMPPKVQVKDCSSTRLIPNHADYHTIRPIWTREARSLQQFDYLTWYVGMSDKPSAYAMGYIWGEVVTFVDIGFLPQQDSALADLLNAIHHLHPESICRMMNVYEDEPAWPMMESLGYEEVSADYEMLWEISV
jgi:ribosomal protein S18 acetylase RimI-like enzyme